MTTKDMAKRIGWFVLFLISLGVDIFFLDEVLSEGGGYLHFALLFVLPMFIYHATVRVIVVEEK
jgi:hypothetical protein